MCKRKEFRCIEQAAMIRLASAEQRLAELRKNRISHQNPWRQISFGYMRWESGPIERIKQVLFLPIAFIILILYWALLAPVEYMLSLSDVRVKKRQLEKEIELGGFPTVEEVLGHIRFGREYLAEKEARLGYFPSGSDVRPSTKTIEGLWELHGLHDHGHGECTYDDEECFALLLKWAEILYGTDISMSLNLKQRVETFRAGWGRSNSGGALFSIPKDVNIRFLVEELSKELPAYNRVGRRIDRL